jgi:hypothetical protein
MKEIAQQSQGIYETVAEQMAQSAAQVSTVAAASQNEQPKVKVPAGDDDIMHPYIRGESPA